MQFIIKTLRQTISTCPLTIRWKKKPTKTKIVVKGEIDTSNTQIHDRSHSCLDTSTSIKKSLNYLYWPKPPL